MIGFDGKGMHLGAESAVQLPDATRQDSHEAELIRFHAEKSHPAEEPSRLDRSTALGVRRDQRRERGDVGGRQRVERFAGVGETAKLEVHGDEGVAKAGVLIVQSLDGGGVGGSAEVEVQAVDGEAEEAARSEGRWGVVAVGGIGLC